MTQDPKKPFNNPFGGLASLREALPQAEAKRAAALENGPARAVVRYERKGRGGKEVTIVEQLELSADERRAWLKALKQELGCGGVVEERNLVLQGDHRVRVSQWLSNRGVKRVSVG